jgi:ribosome-associated heat shock protein Hsp15
LNAAASIDRQRIDKWLWHARIVRTRSAAATLVNSGYVRINGARVDAASRAAKTGDVVTIALDRVVKVLKVQGFCERRGDATLAQTLYEDLTEPLPPPEQRVPQVAAREPGASRPTKRDRRLIDKFTSGESG